PERIGWFEMDEIALDHDNVVVRSKNRQIVAGRSHHAAAAAWILKEALDRIPKRVAAPPDRVAPLLEAAEGAGSGISIEPMQVAGRRCKASNVIISFERDARTCARCGEIYDKKHVPSACLTCEAPMAST